ncbi:MAG TPA: cytochrome c biogenesis CcdA family protein [Catenuloplanes sp.]
MGETPLALAVAAGMLAAVNPCGFALLPAYLSLLVLDDAAPGRFGGITRALSATAAMTLGFVAVFGLFGLVLAPVAGQIQRHLPWFTAGLGVLLAAMGVWLLTGRTLPGLRLPVPGQAAVTRSWPSMVAYGVAYAAASLSCTIGPFLAIVVASARAGSAVEGVALFVAYAAGMGLVVGAAALAVAVAHQSLLGRVRRLAPVISRLAGVLLLAAGAYIAYYGWYEIRLLRGRAPDDPVINAAGDVQRWLATTVDSVGAPALAATCAVLLAAGVGLAAARRRTREPADNPP